ncbi:MAG: ACP S-malonyltransferase, partial [Candidatus Omnitrophica bacterium]|nr:ACP S-malonyltransferase [Candidatus Omnitrophota bacterium]
MVKIAYIFPGQGAQAVGMGREFYDTSPEAKQIFDEADQLIDGLTDVIFNGPQEKLTSTAFCQP